jgi:hypothetical protein
MSSKRKSRRKITTESFLRSLNEGLGGEQGKHRRIILKEMLKGFIYVNL